MSEPSLPIIQAWMQSVLRHPAGVAAGAEALRDQTELGIAEVITPSARQSAADRLAIYGRAYWARLLDCLGAEFPAVKAAAGDEAFAGFAAGYLQAHPSQSKSLNDLGRRFSEYLSASRPPRSTEDATLDYADFLIDLAALEWCYSEVFDAIGPETAGSLSHDAVLSLGRDEFARSRLQFHETVRLLTLTFPCQEYASAVRQSGELRIPQPAPTHLVVYRRDYVVRRFVVPAWQHKLLRALQAGTDITGALAITVAFESCPPRLEEELRRCFSNWTDAPIFRGLSPSQ